MAATKLETLVCLTALAAVLNLSNGLLNGNAAETSKQWKLISYNFPPNAQINDRKFYNPENVLITGLAVGLDRIFIATPQLLSGVPSALSAIPKSGMGDSPVLEAFPDWTFATGGRNDFNCSDLKIVSVYRLKIDSCNRLWVLDAGISRSLEDYEITCPPKILVIDLNTNLVVRRIDFPPEVLRGESLLTNLIIDETTSKRGTCDDVFVYISDTVEPALIVYDSQQDVTWRVTHPSMHPDPDFAQSEILGDRFVLMDGVVGLAFDDKSGILYFQPLATDRVFSVTREVLRGGPLASNQLLPVKLVGKKSSQGISLGVSPIDGSLLFSPFTETAIASWNPQTGRQSILASDSQRLQFVADIGTSFFEPGVIYLVSSKFQRFFLKNLNTNEYNNRILRIDLNAIAEQSLPALTAPPSRTQSYSYYHSNSLEKRPTFGLPIDDNFFSSASTGLTTRQPFRFEQVGVVQQSFRNPFTALNQGEALPTRLTRVPPVRSFLDNLPPSGYTYRRLNRSAASGGAKSR